MANVAVYNIEGKEVGTIDLNDAIFGVEVNEHLVDVYKRQALETGVSPEVASVTAGSAEGSTSWRSAVCSCISRVFSGVTLPIRLSTLV